MKKSHQLFLLTAVSTAFLAACGGGGDGDTFSPTGEKVFLSPDIASVDVGHSIPMRITGGLGPYQMVSSNPQALPAPGKIDNLHAADVTITTGEIFLTETVTITVTDSKGSSAKSDIQIKAVTMAVTPTALTLPSTQTQTFKLFGGKAPFTITSSRPDLLSIDTTKLATSKEFGIVAKNVTTTTEDITLNIVDASGTTVTAKVGITPPNPVFKSVQVNPSGSGLTPTTVSAITAGQRGAIQIAIDPNQPLPREITLQRLTGDYSLEDTQVEVGSNHIALTTLSVPSNATTQIATLRVTDKATGKFIDHAFQIAGFALSASPKNIALESSTPDCKTGQAGSFQIMGGMAPYAIWSSAPSAVSVTPTTVPQNGGTTTLTAYGCTPAAGATLTVIDATGAEVNVQFTNTATPAPVEPVTPTTPAPQ